MKKRGKRILCKRNLIFVFISLLMIGSFFSYSYGGEDGKMKWGFAFSGGTNVDFIHNKPDLKIFAFHPRVDIALHRNWDLEFEGNFFYYWISDEKNLYLLGINSNILYKAIQWNTGSLFLIMGGGVGYNNSNGHVNEIGKSHIAGVLQGGAGIYFNVGKDYIIRGEYRLQHISDPFYRDTGINTHNFIVGLSF